jgi:hypothetical protein
MNLWKKLFGDFTEKTIYLRDEHHFEAFYKITYTHEIGDGSILVIIPGIKNQITQAYSAKEQIAITESYKQITEDEFLLGIIE